MKTRVYISGINVVLSSDEIIELRKEYIGRNKHHRSFKIRGKIFTGLTDKEVENSDIKDISEKRDDGYFPEMTKAILLENFSELDVNDMEKDLKMKIYKHNRENIKKLIKWSNCREECYQKLIIENILEKESPTFLIIPSVFVKKMSISASTEKGEGEFELLLYQKFNLNESIVEIQKGDNNTDNTEENAKKQKEEKDKEAEEKEEEVSVITDKEIEKRSANIGVISEDEKELKIPTFTLWKTKKGKYTDSDNNISNDLIYGDKSNLDNLNLKTEKKRIEDKNYLIKIFKDLVKLLSMGEMEEVGLEMVDLFLKNKSIETEYKNPVLTKYVQEHNSTRKFIEEVKKILETYISEHYEELLEKSEFERKNIVNLNKDVDNMFQKKVHLPTFSDLATWKRLAPKDLSSSWTEIKEATIQIIKNKDCLRGGTILIDSINSLEVTINNFSYSNKKISYELEIKMYDHFGLDEGDKKHFDKNEGFIAWYILQKYQKYSCVPFITDLSFKEKIEKEL